jgi:hypothetical protein
MSIFSSTYKHESFLTFKEALLLNLNNVSTSVVDAKLFLPAGGSSYVEIFECNSLLKNPQKHL